MNKLNKKETKTVSFTLVVNSKRPLSFVIVPTTEFKFKICEALNDFLLSESITCPFKILTAKLSV